MNWDGELIIRRDAGGAKPLLPRGGNRNKPED